MSRLKAISLGALASVCALPLAAFAYAAEDVPRQFDIGPQSLASALSAFARQSQQEILFAPEIVVEKTSNGVQGTLQPLVALGELLRNTGLAFTTTSRGAILVAPRRISGSGAAPYRLAQVSQPAQGASAAPQEAIAAPEASDGRRATPDSGGLEEVIVTAQKKSESALDVPISLSVLGVEELEALRVQGVEDFILNVPNASFTTNGFFPRVSLRGISVNTGGRFDPIGVTVDDVAYGTTETDTITTARFLDIERIEVLRGPQGTLTGSNSLGGTINIITPKPDPSAFEFRGTVDLGRFNTSLYKAVVNTPLNETLAFRTVAFVESSDGAVVNLGPAGGRSNYDNFGTRLAMRWLPGERLTLDVSLAYEEQRHGLNPQLYIDRVEGDPGAVNTAAALAALGGDYFDRSIGFIEDVGLNGGALLHDTRESMGISNFLGSLRATYAMDRHTLDLIYGHFDHEQTFVIDGDASEYALSRTTYANDFSKSDGVELRASSAYEGPVNWVAGLVWHSESNPYDELAEFGDDDPSHPDYVAGETQPGGEYGVLFYRYAQDLIHETSAAFANLFWDITERVHLAAGVRVTRSKTAFGSACCGNYDPGGIDEPLPALSLPSEELTEVSPRLALNFDLSDDATLYAQYATGFRTGYGNDPRSVGLHDTTQGRIDVPEKVDSEQVRNYEVGIKGRLFEDRASLALAAFHMDYTDMQVFGGFTTDGGFFSDFDLNAGKAYIRGLELEAAARLFTGFELRASGGLIDSEIEELLVGDNGETLRNVDIPAVRPWNFTLGGLYEFSVSDDLTAHFRADYTRQGRMYGEFNEEPANEIPEFETVNINAGVTGERWSVTAYIENALNEIYWLNITSPFVFTGSPVTRGSLVTFNPRTYGLRVTYRLRD